LGSDNDRSSTPARFAGTQFTLHLEDFAAEPKPAPGSHTMAEPRLRTRLETGKIGGAWCVLLSIPNRPVEEQTGVQRRSAEFSTAMTVW
jgi:hypothetical protein